MIGAAFRALVSHWRRRRLQLAALITGLALATALWTGVQAINAEARASYARAAGEVQVAALPQITRAGGVTMEDFYTLRAGGWLVTPVVEGRVQIGDRSLRLLGLDPLTAPAALRPAAMTPETLSRLPVANGTATPATAPRYAAPDIAAEIGAIAAPGLPPGLLVTEVTAAAEMLGRPGRLSRLTLLPEQPLRQAALADLGPYSLSPAAESTDLGRLTESFHLNLTAFGFLAFAVGLFVVHGTIGLAFEERRPMIRTLRALGLPLRLLAALLAAELTVLALIGGGIGVVLGGWIAAQLLPDVASSLRGLYGAEVSGSLTIRPVWWLAGLGMALGGTWVAGAGALLQLARLPLLAPARPRAWARAGRRLARLGALAGLVLLAVAALALGVAPGLGAGLLWGFAGLAALLLGAAALLPFLLSRALALGARLARRPLAQWAWADTGQQLPGLSLALMALMLALAANIGVSTMVGSFRQTFLGWLDQRLAADLYVIARDDAEAERLEAWLEPRVEAVLPVWRIAATAEGAAVSLYGFRDDPIYRQSWPLLSALPEVWTRAARGEGVLINEQLARRLDKAPGASLSLPGWETRVLGVYSDYGNPNGQVMMALDRLVTLYPGADRRRFGLRLAPGTAPALRKALTETFDLPPGVVTDQATQKAAARGVFERTFLVTGALNALTLAVAGFAMLTALTTLSGMRLPQLAPVWAMGMGRRQLAALEVLRALGLAALTFCMALPVGLALAWALLAVINVQAFGWRLPMFLYPADLARLFLWAMLAAGLAATLPALRLARRPVADLLRVFAGER
ncbi:ABC transporter permease [Frigidibacter sp. ROC022]|uniref:ABC transporter permease n=1 Tax=Frigidibacter sp. ROC022 TaxID=2971796 RepID=UPI00215A1168|nr:ABC transporter permease [Frigidibacter sp. ROC022]MCR8725051.1 ABC transporter permease [Frigidibacter sp. ROC022]